MQEGELGYDGLGLRADWRLVRTIKFSCQRMSLNAIISDCIRVLLGVNFALRIDFVFVGLRGVERVDVGPEFDDLAEEIRRFAFPIRHGFLSVGVSWGKLERVSV
jgi:hypothetical protein